mgnify:CR=1 FL=1|jgi:hypothetical protein|tara:strand:- start:12103 stop:12618 length:516 start_codon:yes stop_codon:yes gene_type:complete
MSVSNNLLALKKRLSQLENKIELEKSRARFKDTKQKRSFGKIMILAGAGKYIDVKSMSDRDIIMVGALVVTANLPAYKISHILGALSLIFEKCNDQSFKEACEIKGGQFYDDKKLEDPHSLFLGVSLYAKEILTSTNDLEKIHEIGNSIFEKSKAIKKAKYLEYKMKNMVK